MIDLPKNVEDLPIGMNSDEYVWHGDKLEIRLFGIWEVDLRFPDRLDEVRVGKVKRNLDVRVRKSGVAPLLTQVGVCYVVLPWGRNSAKFVMDMSKRLSTQFSDMDVEVELQMPNACIEIEFFGKDMSSKIAK